MQGYAVTWVSIRHLDGGKKGFCWQLDRSYFGSSLVVLDTTGPTSSMSYSHKRWVQHALCRPDVERNRATTWFLATVFIVYTELMALSYTQFWLQYRRMLPAYFICALGPIVKCLHVKMLCVLVGVATLLSSERDEHVCFPYCRPFQKSHSGCQENASSLLFQIVVYG